MANPSPMVWSLLFVTTMNFVLPFVSGPREWWPPHGNIRIKCPYKKVHLDHFHGTVDPCDGLKQPVCGTDFVTYDNPCILCVESLKSHGKIKFLHDGRC